MNKQDIKMIAGIGATLVGMFGFHYISEKNKRNKEFQKRMEETERELKDLRDRLDKTTSELSKDIDVEVPKKVVDDAIHMAVNKEVHKAVDMAVNLIRRDIDREVREEVSKAVSVESDDITKRVSEKITDEVSKISSNGLASTVRREATNRVVAKFDGELDDLLEKYTNNLDNIAKVYSSISKKFSGDDNSTNGKDLKISLM